MVGARWICSSATESRLDERSAATSQNLLAGLPGGALPWLGGLVLLVAVLLAWRKLRRQRGRLRTPPPNLTLDLAALGEGGPPAGPPVLELYNLPVRLAAIVLAPAGRVRELPRRASCPTCWPRFCRGWT